MAVAGRKEQVGRRKEGRKTKQLYRRKCNRPHYADQALEPLNSASASRHRQRPPVHIQLLIASPDHLTCTYIACPPLAPQSIHSHVMHIVSGTSTTVRLSHGSPSFHRIFRLRPQARLYPPAPLQTLCIRDVISTSGRR